ncbi:MAG: M56 family metallopeptidase, partial [Chitinophagaceae bacterium]
MNFTALQNSPFLQSLGWAIANSLWQAAALWIAYHLVNGAYKSASSKFKNNFTTILLSLSFVWFCFTLFNRYFSIQSLSVDSEFQYYQTNSINTLSYNWNDIINNVAGVLPYLSIAYLLLLIFLSIRLINIYRFTRFIKFNGLQKADVEWKLFAEKVAMHMGITKKIRLWVSNHIDVPATIGFLKPVILIPLASLNQLSADQLEAIILHELSHIKRNDYLINLFISIIETILFFNPFVVLLAKIIKRERENCCDDLVIQYQYDRHTYASALLSLEQFRNINLRLAIGATSGKKQLLLRIKRIMEVNNNTNFNYGQKLLALLLITGVICSVAWLSPQSNSNKKHLASKSNTPVFDRQIFKEVKPAETLILKQNNVEVKNTVIKSQPKKGLRDSERELKDLKDLNIKEIAEAELRRRNFLSQESKKELPRKFFQKYNSNKLLFAKDAARTRSLFVDGTTMIPVKPALANAYFNNLQSYNIDLQKLQKEWDKAQFTFSFDEEEMQNVVKKKLILKHTKTTLAQLHQNLNDAEIEKLISTYLQKSDEKKIRRVQFNRVPGTYAGSNGKSFYIFDSLVGAEIKVVKDRTKHTPGEGFSKAITTVKHLSPAYPEASAYSYRYGYDINLNDENSDKKKSVKVYNRSNIPDVSCAPVIPG